MARFLKLNTRVKGVVYFNPDYIIRFYPEKYEEDNGNLIINGSKLYVYIQRPDYDYDTEYSHFEVRENPEEILALIDDLHR